MTITIYKGRTKVLPLSLQSDVSNDICTFQIRTGRNRETELIAEWQVEFVTDGEDGELLLTLDDSVTNAITQRVGWMDGKRLVGGAGGEPYPLIETPIQVVFQDVVTE